MKPLLYGIVAGLVFFTLNPNLLSQVIISEFMASNSRTLLDEDGQASDWIEIQNISSTNVHLLDWALTDNPANLNQWRFPDTNLHAGSFMVIFASNKDRRVPGAPLHTSFALSAGGEFLALVRPDGSVASAFSPKFPPQVADASFGYGIENSQSVLLASNASARVFIPNDDSLASLWTLRDFNDGAWTPATNGIGFDTGVMDPVEDSYASRVAASAPLVWYRFSETSGTLATNSGTLGVLNATYLGGFTLAQPGPRPPGLGGFESDNTAPRLNGTSGRVQVPDVAAFDLGTGPFSISIWFNPANAGTRGDLVTYKGAGGDFGIHVASSGANTISAYHNSFVGTASGVSNNTWYHFVFTREASGKATGYLNGVPVLSGTDSQTMNIANDLLIGSNHTGSPGTVSATFNGLIDEFAFHARALTAEEVAAQFQVASTAAGRAFAAHLATDVQSAMHGQNSSAYIRIPFVVENLSAVDRLTLRMKYDDGFVAYVNGIEAASANAADANTWNATATARQADANAVRFEEFDLNEARGALLPGTNILAIRGLNISADNPDFLIQAELVATTFGALSTEPRYFLQPTPGDLNGVGSEDVGPIIGAVGNLPALPVRPLDSEDILVTARVSPAFAPLASVTLRWRVMYGVTNTVAMLDDGAHGDGPAGDGVFGAIIPASASAPGQMVRYYVTASDNLGRSSRWPLFEDPLGSPEYLGTVVANPGVTTALPIWEWFAENVAAARTTSGTRGSVFFKGVFYDNIRVRRRGAATTNGQKFDFLRGFRCDINDELQDVDEVNLNNEASDPSFIRPPMAWETFRVAGNAACLSFNMLMRVNGGPDRVGIFIEQVDERFLERNRMNPEGALYKFVQRGALTPIFNDPTDGVEKKTRLDEDRSDLAALCAALSLTNTAAARLAFLMDHVNLPALMTHLACRSMTMDSDDVRKNIYMYRDTLGNREWTILPWDKDWSFGIEGDGGTFLRHPFFGDQAHAKQNANQWSLLYNAVFTEPKLSEMYLRRLRTVLDQQLQPPGTTIAESYFEGRMAEWFPPVFPHVGTGPSNAVFGATGSIRSFLPGRRNDLYVTYSVTNLATAATNRLVPLAQLPNVAIQIGEVEYNPASGNQAEEYVQLLNNNPFAVDISGWQIEGAIQHTFRAGTVILSSNALYLSPDVVAFRARSSGPRGGQSLLVQGNYQGQLSARGETISLKDDRGRPVHTKSYNGNPSPAQQHLRITEIMYHPSPLSGNASSPELFEFLELKNISPDVTLNLANVRFVNGVTFNFTGSAVTSLAPGGTVLVVRDLAAFTARYGTGLNVAGAFAGALENGGERLQLVDAAGEEILDFAYDNAWHPITDGLGFSLVIVDQNAEPDTWDRAAQWRPSSVLQGSPSANDPAPPSLPSVLISEALTRTDVPPPTDTIELHNPTSAPANIGGWFLSDDFNTPKKFRIPDNTQLTAGGYLTFDESQFNAGPTAFALSSDGDELWLFSADAAGNLTGYVHGHRFGAADDGVTFGRHVTSTGEEHFVAQAGPSLGGGNAGPRVGPLVISEIHYHPSDLTNGDDNAGDEFIELRHTGAGGAPVALFDGARPTNTWRISGAVEFAFPTNQTVASGASLLLVNFDPADASASAAFRARFNVPAEVPLFGPLSGKLDNSGESIALLKPATAVVGERIPYVVMDQVDYRDSAPWPAAADASGASLQRIQDAFYGNDPANWIAAAPTAGTPRSGGGVAPAISVQPVSQTVVATVTATLSVTASGSAPLRYQWRFNGGAIPGATNSILSLENASAEDAGNYSVLIYNSAGSTVSSNANIGVIYAAFILQQPASVQVRVKPDPQAAPTTNATFSVLAYSTSTLSYQWRRNGIEIPGARERTLTVTNVQVSDGGDYSCAITDDIGTVYSAPAALYPLVTPTIVHGITPQVVTPGAPVTLSVIATGSPLPFGFEWRRGSLTVVSNTVYSMTNFYTFIATNVPATNQYRVIVRNLASQLTTANSLTTVITMPDFDGDGMVDAYEAAIGLNTNNAADAVLDQDGDGMTTRDEFLAGTDPQDASSYLKVLPPKASAGQVTVEFGAISNRTYTVQYTDAWRTQPWQKLTDLAALGTNRVERIADPAWTEHRFYRVVLPAQP